MLGYEHVSSNEKVRKLLNEKGGYSSQEDYLTNRMSELKGMTQTIKSDPRYLHTQTIHIYLNVQAPGKMGAFSFISVHFGDG